MLAIIAIGYDPASPSIRQHPMTAERYLIPAAIHRVEEEIKRSRFITTVAYTPTLAGARDFIAGLVADNALEAK